MTAIYKAPGEAAKIVDIDNTLEALQKAVGGRVDTVTLCTDLVLICNDDGFLEGLPLNCNICSCPFYGPILLVGVAADEFTGLKNPETVMRLLGWGDR